MDYRTSVRRNENNKNHYGYTWRVNGKTCYIDILEVHVDNTNMWDAYIFPYQSTLKNLTVTELELLPIYSTPDETLYSLLIHNEFNNKVATLEAVTNYVEGVYSYDAKFVSFFLSKETFIAKFFDCETIETFSKYIEDRINETKYIFEF